MLGRCLVSLSLVSLLGAVTCAGRTDRAVAPDEVGIEAEAQYEAEAEVEADRSAARSSATIPEGHLPITAVPQRDPFLGVSGPQGLLFGGGRPLVAAQAASMCVVWNIPSGVTVGVFEIDGISVTPCECWGGLSEDPPRDPPTIVSSEDDPGEIVVRGATGATLLEFQPCGGCTYAEILLNETETLVAALFIDAANNHVVELWDTKTGARRHRFPFATGIEDSFVLESMRWVSDGVVLIGTYFDEQTLDCLSDDDDEIVVDPPTPRRPCTYDSARTKIPRQVHALASYFFPADGGATFERVPLLTEDDIAHEVDYDVLEFDGSGRWLLWPKFGEGEDDFSYHPARLVRLTPTRSKLRWEWPKEVIHSSDPYDSVRTTARWVTGSATTLIEAREDIIANQDDLARLSWLTIEVEASGVERHGARVLEANVGSPHVELEVLGTHDGHALVDWSVRTLSRIDPFEAQDTLDFAGCEVISAAPQLDYVLARCDRAALIEPGLDGSPGRIATRLPFDELDHRWLNDGSIAALGSDGRLMIIDPIHQQVRLDRQGVDSFVEVARGPEQGRLGLVSGAVFELLDIASGEPVYEGPAPAGRVGLTATGDRLVYINDRVAHVVALADGTELGSWPSSHTDIVWRQDDRLVLVGDERPRRLVDPSSGRLLAKLDFGPWLRLSPEALDPSWRWAWLDRGRILRTLDAEVIHVTADAAWFDSGLHEGAVQLGDVLGGYRYRIGTDPLGIPCLGPESLTPYLAREGLLDAFFSGQPIAPPSIPAENARALDVDCGEEA